jgi:hypothetical protein
MTLFVPQNPSDSPKLAPVAISYRLKLVVTGRSRANEKNLEKSHENF